MSSESAISEKVNFFESVPTVISEESSYLRKCSPVTSVQLDAPILYEFDVPEGQYADLNNSFHYVKFKILKGDRTSTITDVTGENPPVQVDIKKTLVAPINNFGSSCFSNLELYLNNVQIETSNNLYPFKAILQTLLSYNKNVRDSQFKMSMFSADTGGIDSETARIRMHQNTCDNVGLKYRFNKSKYSTPFETINKLFLDIVNQPKYILNGTNVKIKFHRATPEFCLIAGNSTEKYHILIEDAALYLRMVHTRDSLQLAVEKNINITEGKYPLKKIDMRFFTLSGNSTNISEQNLYNGSLPTRIAIAIIPTAAMDGTYTTSPFNFRHFNVATTELRVNGLSVPPEGIDTDIENNNYVHAYANLFLGTGGLFNNDNGNIMTYEDFKNGNYINLYDLTEDGNHDLDHFHPAKTGVISLNIRLTQAPGDSVAVIVMIEKEVVLLCDKDRNYRLTE